jgi:hypothetical protein
MVMPQWDPEKVDRVEPIDDDEGGRPRRLATQATGRFPPIRKLAIANGRTSRVT